MNKPLENILSGEEDDSQRRIAQKEIVAKIRTRLKHAAAKKKSRLHRKITSVTRHLNTSTHRRSQSRLEASLYERTLLFNNRKLAQAMQNLRQENKLKQDRIVELNYCNLDLEVQQAILSNQLTQEQQKNTQMDKMMSKLKCKFKEIAELFNYEQRDLSSENRNSPIGNEASNNHLPLNETFVEKPFRNSCQSATVSSNEEDSSTVECRRQLQRLSNPYDLSAIIESPDISINDSVCRSFPSSITASEIPAALCQIDSGKSRRETFVVHASQQISDLPSPLKSNRPRSRMRRSDSFEPMLRLSETPEKTPEMNNSQATITIEVDMELTSVLNSAITGFDPICKALFPAARKINSSIVEETDSNLQITDNTILGISTVISNGDATILGDDNNNGTTHIVHTSNEKRLDNGSKFVTERLSNKDGKRSTISARASQKGFTSTEVAFQETGEPFIIPEQVIATRNVTKTENVNSAHSPAMCEAVSQKVADNLSRQDEIEAIDVGNQMKKETIGEKHELTKVHAIPEKGLENNPEKGLENNPEEKNELTSKRRRVSFADEKSQPPEQYSKTAKPKRKKSTAPKTLAYENNDDGFPLTKSSTKNAATTKNANSVLAPATCEPSIHLSQKVPDNFPRKDKIETTDVGNHLKKETIIEKSEVTAVLHMPAKGLEKNPDVPSATSIIENNELTCKNGQVSCADTHSQPPEQYSKKAKPKQKRIATSKTLAYENEEDMLPLAQLSTKYVGSPANSKRSCSNEDDQKVTNKKRKSKRLTIKKEAHSNPDILIVKKTANYPDSPDRSVLGQVSPNRMASKPKAKGKQVVNLCQSILESGEKELQDDKKSLVGKRRTRTPVVYKEPSLNLKMRR